MFFACQKNVDFTLRVQDMDYYIIYELYIMILYLKRWIWLRFRPHENLRNLFSRVDASCQEYLTKCHIKNEDPKILALVMKELPKDLEYHLSLLEGPNNGMRSWQIKIKLVHNGQLIAASGVGDLGFLTNVRGHWPN